ncbi:MAG: class I SAM-dependent methyltransferase [Anaerolineales bacterium]|nr:class I SAM-dependent methyltransferase [Anaerolineales bacterium]
MEEHRIKEEVKQFYDQVGWTLVSEDVYQNARYEDLRPVSRDYIHRCHLRVAQHLKSQGRFLLDAGSGPVQYPEYLEYQRGYLYRVCADISYTALTEARKRLTAAGCRGLYVVADVANLPFRPDVFDGIISLHTIHHLTEDEHLQAYQELHRVLAPQSSAVVVHGWPDSRLMRFFEPFVKIGHRLRSIFFRVAIKQQPGRRSRLSQQRPAPPYSEEGPGETEFRKGTFTSRHDVAWVKNEVGAHMEVEIRVWRSASVRFLRAVIHPYLGGRAWLRLLYWLEERYPHFFGEQGKYPLIVIRKK